jgi:translation initiation factor 3 subunit F
MSDTDSFLHLARPLGPAPVGAQPSTAPLNVAIQPQVCAAFKEAPQDWSLT